LAKYFFLFTGFARFDVVAALAGSSSSKVSKEIRPKVARKSSQAIEIIGARKLARGRLGIRFLFQAELSTATGGWRKIAQRIGFAFLEFGVALVRFQVLRPNRMMADCAHLSCFTISAARGDRLRPVA
jgi:hypothetical protein